MWIWYIIWTILFLGLFLAMVGIGNMLEKLVAIMNGIYKIVKEKK